MSAERHAQAHGLTELVSLRLPESCAAGDLVSLEAGSGVRHDFSIIRRRWMASETSAKLEITLDYPATSARR